MRIIGTNFRAVTVGRNAIAFFDPAGQVLLLVTRMAISREIFFNLVRTSPLVLVRRHTLGDDQPPQQEHGPQVGSRLSRQRNRERRAK